MDIDPTAHNCVCKLRTSRKLNGSEVAYIVPGLRTSESHASPSSMRIVCGAIKSSIRFFSEEKINIAGVHNYEGTCVMIWLTMLRLSTQLRDACFPIDIQWTNIQATAYLPFTVDLPKLHKDPRCATAIYDRSISCFRMNLIPEKKIHLSLFPSGALVITGAPSVYVAKEALRPWLPILEEYKLQEVDPAELRKRKVEEANSKKPVIRKRKKTLLSEFMG